MQLGKLLFVFVMIHTMKYWRPYFQERNYITTNWFWKEKLTVVVMGVNAKKNYNTKFPPFFFLYFTFTFA